MRREDNFQQLVKNTKIIIPIIQRDYAQGRNNPKAIVVRTRLIDEWIDILKDKNLRMDFNYIYGNETRNIFYPVDGQQRLTSLYLLYWYLAMATNNADEIDEWQFDYKTRNSASEFFAFLHDTEKSDNLFKILHSGKKEDDKQFAIRNESWFKTKWENDPTVVSCINFLCMLSDKLSNYEEEFISFWDRLNDTDCPAVYFTCLTECDDEFAEIEAAKKYTRMNARGKRLTNFENLKAMIDEIEMKHINELEYCMEDEQDAVSNSISWVYDRNYIDCMFRSIKETSLIEKTKIINDESEKWFRLVYYVYALSYDRKIPSDLSSDSGALNENYEDVIYKISQERVEDNKIVKYLYMLKAVFEVLCNSGNELAFRYDSFILSDRNSKIDAISLILLIEELWDKNNSRDENAILVGKWKQFRRALRDLEIYSWNVKDDHEIAVIVSWMVKGISKCSTKSIDEFFVTNDLITDSPFESMDILDDLKCRLLERKIKSKLVVDGAIIEAELDKVPVGTRRWGYLFYICGFLSDWSLNDWSSKNKWDGTAINDYIQLIGDKEAFKAQMNTREAKVVFAYASQYIYTRNSLLSPKEIDKCNNEHIWNSEYLEWNDDEYDDLAEKKIKMLDHLKVMFDLLLAYKAKKAIPNDELIAKYVELINLFFESSTGYEKCWLRFAAKYSIGGEELLTSELQNENGVVKVKNVPVILKTFLVENGYSYLEKISRIKDFNKKCNFFTADENRVLYAATNKTCTFAPDADNSGKYQHSQKTTWGWDLSGNTVNRNMDLFYRAYFNFTGMGAVIKNNFWSIDIAGGVYIIKLYEIGNLNAGKLMVNVRQANIDANMITQIENNISQWKNRFDTVEKEATKTENYDHWIELWNNDYQTAFGSDFAQGAVTYDKNGAQRPKKVWSEVFSVPVLNWSISTIDI